MLPLLLQLLMMLLPESPLVLLLAAFKPLLLLLSMTETQVNRQLLVLMLVVRVRMPASKLLEPPLTTTPGVIRPK